MNKQKLGNLFILSLLFVLGIIYGAQVFVNHSKVVTQTVATNAGDENTENSEEKVNETSQNLFLEGSSHYHLKTAAAVAVNLKACISKKPLDAYLELNTPPPNFT